MKSVNYGGVEFELVKTDTYLAEPVRSDDKTEVLYMRTTVGFTVIWNPGATSYAGDQGGFAAVDGASPATTDRAIKFHMMKPRLPFLLVSDDGVPLLAAPEPGFDRDPEDGPIPLDCNVASVGPKTWRVAWRAVICTRPCATGSAADSYGQTPILSNRWSQSQETGMDRLTTVTTRGVTVFDAGLVVNSGKSADFWRDACIPACALDYQRPGIQAQVNTAGTVLAWAVVDRAMFTSIGATDDPGRGTVERFEASFAMRSSAPDANGVPTRWLMARFDGMAWGSKNSSRQAMLGWLARLAIERAAIPNGQVDPGSQPMILSATSSENLHAPFVDLHMDMQFPRPRWASRGSARSGPTSSGST